MPDVELHLPPDVRYIGLARLVVCAAARQSGMAEQRIEDLRIAVSEATTNAVMAHQRVERALPVVLQFGPSPDGFSVTVRDTGPGFEPKTPEELASREWGLEHGLGVTLIRGLADEVEFVRVGGMRVHMRFAVGLEADAGTQDGEGRPGHHEQERA